jgi:hypothetical protein
MVRNGLAVIALLASSLIALTGCPGEPLPPVPPPPPPPVAVDSTPIAGGADSEELRAMVHAERERLRGIIDLAERRELVYGWPRMLARAKAHVRDLDQIDGRLGHVLSDSEADEVSQELHDFDTRLSAFAHTLRTGL